MTRIAHAFLLLLVLSTSSLADDATPPRFRLDDRATPLSYAWRLAIDHAEAVVQGELDDALAYLGAVGATGHAGLAT